MLYKRILGLYISIFSLRAAFYQDYPAIFRLPEIPKTVPVALTNDV